MRTLLILLFSLVFLQSCKKDAPKQPGSADLVEPAQNEPCTPVRSINANNSEVRFRWQPTDHTDSYVLHITNLLTDKTEEENVFTTTANITLAKGAPYSWFVVSKNNEVLETSTSAIWSFYNPGSQTNHVPFPASVINPTQGSTVANNKQNQVTLQWSGNDLDDDIEEYEIYFSEENPPTVLAAIVDGDETSLAVTVLSKKLYYWRIITIDAQGNSSDTGVLEFRVN